MWKNDLTQIQVVFYNLRNLKVFSILFHHDHRNGGGLRWRDDESNSRFILDAIWRPWTIKSSSTVFFTCAWKKIDHLGRLPPPLDSTTFTVGSRSDDSDESDAIFVEMMMMLWWSPLPSRPCVEHNFMHILEPIRVWRRAENQKGRPSRFHS